MGRGARITAAGAVAAGALFIVTACTSGSGSPHASIASGPPPTSGTSSSGQTGQTGTDWPTYHRDLARTGFAASMPAASGRLRVAHTVRLDGAVYASPIVVAGVTYAATEHDTVYALDAAGAVRWHVHLGEPSPASDRPCGNIDPLGITGTPGYDAATKSVFVVAEYRGKPPRHELVALDAGTGAVRFRTSVDLPGADATVMQERGALTVTAGRVWVPFGGLDGDCGQYKGRVVGVPTDGRGAVVSFTVPTSARGGIWTPPGPSVDAAGRLIVSVGNGASGAGDPYDHSDSVLALDTAGHIVDSFSPSSWATDNDNDKDLGSQGPALVGPWVLIAGKSGTAYVLRQDHLGGIGGQVSSIDLCRSFGGTAVADGIVYVPCTDGIRAIAIDGAGHITVRWHASAKITGSPVVGGGRVWSLDPNAGLLHALDPHTGRSLAQVKVGTASRFATPAISGSTLIIPTMTGITVVAAS